VTLRAATWNVNSLDVRLSRLFDRLVANAPDIVGPQDCRQPAFPENHGRSIDRVLPSPALARVCPGCGSTASAQGREAF